MNYKNLIEELFDKPWKLEDITHSDIGNHIRNEIQNQYDKVSRYKLYKAEGNNGHIIEFHNTNAMEIHHVDNNGISGLIHNNDKPNPRYISTMMDRIKYHTLQKNRTVRIVSANRNLVNHYHRISKLIAKKSPINISDIIDYDKEHTAFYISPHNSNHIVEIFKQYNNTTLTKKFANDLNNETITIKENNIYHTFDGTENYTKLFKLINKLVLEEHKKINVYIPPNLIDEYYTICKLYAENKSIVINNMDNDHFFIEPYISNKYENIIESFKNYR